MALENVPIAIKFRCVFRRLSVSLGPLPLKTLNGFSEWGSERIIGIIKEKKMLSVKLRIRGFLVEEMRGHCLLDMRAKKFFE